MPIIAVSQEVRQRTNFLDNTQKTLASLIKSIKQVFNVVVSKLHDVKNPEDLLNRLQELSTQSPMYMAIYQKYNDLYKSIYTFNEDG